MVQLSSVGRRDRIGWQRFANMLFASGRAAETLAQRSGLVGRSNAGFRSRISCY
jgi:hypothetical protein